MVDYEWKIERLSGEITTHHTKEVADPIIGDGKVIDNISCKVTGPKATKNDNSVVCKAKEITVL